MSWQEALARNVTDVGQRRRFRGRCRSDEMMGMETMRMPALKEFMKALPQSWRIVSQAARVESFGGEAVVLRAGVGGVALGGVCSLDTGSMLSRCSVCGCISKGPSLASEVVLVRVCVAIFIDGVKPVSAFEECQ